MAEDKNIQQEIAVIEAKLKKLRELSWATYEGENLNAGLVKEIWNYIDNYGSIEIFVNDDTSYLLTSSNTEGFDYLTSTGVIAQVIGVEQPGSEGSEDPNSEEPEVPDPEEPIPEPLEEGDEAEEDSIPDDNPPEISSGDVTLGEGDTVEKLKDDLKDKQSEQTLENKEVWLDFVENHFKKFILDFEKPIMFLVDGNSYEITANDSYGLTIEYNEEQEEDVIVVTSTNKIILNNSDIADFRQALEDSNVEGDEGNPSMDDTESPEPDNGDTPPDEDDFSKDDIHIEEEEDPIPEVDDPAIEE